MKKQKMIKSNLKQEFNCNVEKLWQIITDNNNYAWRSDLSKIEIIDSTHFIEYTKNNFPTYFTITKKDYLKEYRFNIKNANIKGEWIGRFIKINDEKTLLDFTEEIEVNKLFIKLLAKPYLKNQQKRYFRDLEKALRKVVSNLKEMEAE